MAEMNFDMANPCPHCPFRCDIPGYLRQSRVIEIMQAVTTDKTFACHQTTSATTSQKRDKRGRFLKRVNQHCAGALILLRKTRTEGAMQQIARRLGLYDPSVLNMDAPIHKSWQDMIEANDDP